MARVMIGGIWFEPEHCVNSDDPDVDHRCFHDWRIMGHWGNEPRVGS